jgi:hypothetical protein
MSFSNGRNTAKKNTKKPKGKKLKTLSAGNRYLTLFEHPKYEVGEGVRHNVMIMAKADASSIEAYCFALISMGYARGWLNTTPTLSMFYAYSALIKDIIAVMSGEVNPIVIRPRWITDLFGSLAPKTVPTTTGSLVYSWTGLDSVITDSQFICRGYSYFMYDRTNNLQAGGWLTQDPPPAPPPGTDLVTIAAKLYNLISDSDNYSRQLVDNKDYKSTYVKDASAYAQYSPYYGTGNSLAGGAAASSELEVPFSNGIISRFTNYATTTGRVSRSFKFVSGDSTSAFGIGYLRNFPLNAYRTKYAPVYKFLDLDEVVYLLEYYYVKLVQAALANMNFVSSGVVIPTETIFALQQFSYTPQQFRIAVRQAVLQMFSDSQNLAQFINYSSANNAFEPLRTGSNCYSSPVATTMIVPNILIENLRALMATSYDVGSTDKDKLLVIPVWGVYTGAEPPNVYSYFKDEEGLATFGPLFTGVSTNDPNIVDGVDTSGNVCDLNSSSYVATIWEEWNNRLTLLNSLSVNTGNLSGNGAGAFLLMTRAVEYRETNRRVADISPFMRHMIDPASIVRKKVERSKSTKDTKPVEEDYYIPNRASLASQFTTAVSSLGILTETAKGIVNALILPVIVLENNTPPTIRQYRVANMENYVMDIPLTSGAINSRLVDLQALASRMAPGIAAGDLDEITSVIKKLNDNDQGGFVADVFALVGQILPF